MKIYRGYSVDFKHAAVEKMINRGNRKIKEIAIETGISLGTLFQWRNEFANVDFMKKSSSIKNRTVHEKLKALAEFEILPDEKRGEFLRKNGLHEENLKEWRDQIESALSFNESTPKNRQELINEKKKIKELEKELRRKDKALAEASALLILKKKADLIWGSEEDE